MSKIELLGVDLNGDPAIKKTAFIKPQEGQKIHFLVTTAPRGYHPYLVKVLSLRDNVLTFRGVHLDNPDIEFGPDGKPDSFYAVNLLDAKQVYDEKPTTLLEVEPGGEKSYIILFLADPFLALHDKGEWLSKQAMGRPKWPEGAEASVLRMVLKSLEGSDKSLAFKQKVIKELAWILETWAATHLSNHGEGSE
jgi:hypothetical protein